MKSRPEGWMKSWPEGWMKSRPEGWMKSRPEGRTAKRLLLRLLIGMALIAAVLSAQEPPEAKGLQEARDMWKWANFAILAIAVGYGIGKYAPGMFQARSAEIQKGIAEAQQVKRDSEKRAAEMDARMNRLGADIEEFRSHAKADMDREGERIRRETAAQIERIRQQAALEIETAGKTARRELREYAADLALDLAGQRIIAQMGSRTGPAAEAGLIAEFVKDLGNQASQRQGSRN
jgi:F-type H+-transporting ATPase subunit b